MALEITNNFVFTYFDTLTKKNSVKKMYVYTENGLTPGLMICGGKNLELTIRQLSTAILFDV